MFKRGAATPKNPVQVQSLKFGEGCEIVTKDLDCNLV